MRWLYLLIIILGLTQVVSAADDTFRVSTIVGDDTIPPTTPTNLVALPLSTTEIDLSWDASTDNFSLGGYQVWRDSLQIATTTLTNYSDTGLTASTTYSYYIIAFDDALNYSTSSATASTSTFPVTSTSTSTTTPATSGSIQSSKASMELNNLEIVVTETTASISFDTNAYTKATWRWGRTINYELGYVASNLFKQRHETRLTELEPGTVYELEIILTRHITGEIFTKRLQFETKRPIDNSAPPNVTDLSAELLDSKLIKLSWFNPEIDDIAYVRVLSNDYFYPLDSTNGWLVYEGLAETVVDERRFAAGRFYTIFVFDTSGNRSSGAVVYLGDNQSEEPLGENDLPFDPYADFDFADLKVYQNGQLLPSFDGTVTIERQNETLFQIPYDYLPENLKTVILTLVDPTDKGKSFSFLLAINADRTAYEATVGELPTLGYYEVTISSYDYSQRIVAKRSGGLVVSDGYLEDRATRVVEEIRLLVNWPLIFILGAAGLVLLCFLLWRWFWPR